jgi:hypothetical protein
MCASIPAAAPASPPVSPLCPAKHRLPLHLRAPGQPTEELQPQPTVLRALDSLLPATAPTLLPTAMRVPSRSSSPCTPTDHPMGMADRIPMATMADHILMGHLDHIRHGGRHPKSGQATHRPPVHHRCHRMTGQAVHPWETQPYPVHMDGQAVHLTPHMGAQELMSP